MVIKYLLFSTVFLFQKTENDNTKSSHNGVNDPPGKPDLRLDIQSSGGTQSDHTPVTLTTTISRRPAEDSALDYAYDNPAMSNTSTPNSKPHESTF